ncbi:MAG: HtaA domain-containing protein [Corynebacterium sp.]|uniref:HtaA domain-containing protein n=1 Tax=Corynebacterium sp. TaxID=1720 RepID=UPI0026DB9F8E|nr:HtaA domain-containing protein [Corynebacterium sp.]MDO5097954.1 HtaA domain-containing protein [Corynebacterium sp.]
MKLNIRRKASVVFCTAIISTLVNPSVNAQNITATPEPEIATREMTDLGPSLTEEPATTHLDETTAENAQEPLQGESASGNGNTTIELQNEAVAASMQNPGFGFVAEGVDRLAHPQVTLSEGKANWDWVRSFRQYVGRHQETRDQVELDPFNEYLLWPLKQNQQVDLNNLKKLHFAGSVHWTHHGGILDVTLANPTIDFEKKQLLVDGKSAGTLANPGQAVNETQEVLLELTDLKAEVKDGYLQVTSFRPKITSFANDLVGFYQGEYREPFVATIKISGSEGERPDPILWKLFPEKFDHLRPRNIVPDDGELEDKPVTLDPALEKCIRFELETEEPITTKTLQRLFTLPCHGRNTQEDKKVRSLDGLQHAHRLSRVILAEQRVTDLSPLRDLTKIKELDVSGNGLTSISDIGHQPELLNLKANNNKLIDIDQILYLPALTRLELSNNKLFHLNGLPLNKENLRILKVDHNEIESVATLKDYLYLKELNVSHNAIADISPLGKIRGLEKLDASHNFITNPESLAPLAAFDNLTSLRISHNKFESREPLAVFGNRLKDLPEGQPIPQNTAEKPAPKVAPTITTQPKDQSVEVGKTAEFIVVVEGTPKPLIQWQRLNAGKWVDIPGATDATLTVTAGEGTAVDGAQYRAVVQNAVKKMYSGFAVLTVKDVPRTSTQATSTQSTTTSTQPKPMPPTTTPGMNSSKLGTGEIIGIIFAVLGGVGAIIVAAMQHLGITPQHIAKLFQR